MTTGKKPLELPEESIPIRVICCLMAMIAISCSFVFGKSTVPVIDFSAPDIALIAGSVWMCIGGCLFSYHYREHPPKFVQLMVKIAAASILINLARELWLDNQNSQQFQCLYPLVNSLTATSIMSCFELRTRRDILATSTFGLSLMALAGCSGRSIVFGACVFLYILLGAFLLCLTARSYAGTLPGADKRLATTTTGGRFLPALVFSCLLLPCCSIAAFSFMPRWDSTADNLSIQVRAAVNSFMYQHAPGSWSSTSLPEADPNVMAKHKPHRMEQPDKATPSQKTENPAQHAQPKPPPTQQPLVKPTPAPQHPRPVGPAPTAAPNAGKNAPSAAKRQSGAGDAPGSARGHVAPPTAKQQQPPSPPPLTKPQPNQPPPASSQKRSKPSEEEPHEKNKPAGKPASDKRITKAANGDKPKAGKPADKNTGTTKMDKPAKAPPRTVPKPNGIKIPSSESDTLVSMDKPLLASNDILLTLACNRQMYVKLGYYDDFDGRSWHRHDNTLGQVFEPTIRGVDLSSCPPMQMSGAMPMMEMTENFYVLRTIGTFVPAAGVPQQLSLLQPITVDENGNVTVTEPLAPGTKYRAICQCPVYSLDQLRHSPSIADGSDKYVAPYLTLPANQSDRVIDLSAELCRGGTNRFVEAEKIVAYLRKTYQYTLEPVQSAGGENLVDQFLFHSESGDCKAFASAFVVLCRAAGIPSRFVTGFLPGDIDPLTGASCIRRKHGHAWAEIFMAPYGWIAFDPTPGGLLPARPEQQYYNYTEIKRDITQWHGRIFMQCIETALRYSGYALALMAAALGFLTMIMSAGVVRQAWKTVGKSLKWKHPATKVRNRVLARLVKLGVQRQVSDTGGDVLAKLAAILSKNAFSDAEHEENLKRSVGEFFETYNAIVYGNEKEMARLNALAISIEHQFRAGK